MRNSSIGEPEYNKAGFGTFPCIPGTKTPAVTGWKNSKPDRRKKVQRVSEFGVVLGPEDVVIDVDPRNYKPGENQYKDLLKRLGTIPETFTVRTGGGGLHLYFRKPPNIKVESKVPGFKAIDVKTQGGYVIGANSFHPSGGRYTVDFGSPMSISEIPEPLLKLISREPMKRRKKVIHEISTDNDFSKKRFVDFLKNSPPAIEGEGGDVQTYKIACVGKDFGLEEHAVFELMCKYFNPKCMPPWNENDLETKIANAFAYGKNEPGCINPESNFSINESGSSTVITSALKTITAKELIQKEFKEPQWAVPELLPEGLTILAGPPKIGKSWLAFSLSLAVSSGGMFLGKFKSNFGQVLYLALEDNLRRLKSRLEQLSSETFSASDYLHLSDLMNRFDKGGKQQLEEWLDEHPNCVLVIIDTLARFSPTQNTRTTSYDHDSRFLAEMQRMALERRIALVLITHLRKQQSSDPLEQVMGSMGITGTADSIWLLKRGRNECLGTLNITGRDVEEQELALQFEKDSCQWTSLGDAARHQLGQERRKIVEYLEQAGEPAGPKEVAAALKMQVGNVKNLMSNMYTSGQICKRDRGKYYAVTPGDDFSDIDPKSLTQSND